MNDNEDSRSKYSLMKPKDGDQNPVNRIHNKYLSCI